MLSIAEIAPIFARLDEHQGAEVATVDKALRNLTQRLPIAPSDRAGRAFVYDRPGVVALRLTYLAHQFGLHRVLLDPYARFLGIQAHEAVRRVDAGERSFSFHVVARPIGTDLWASWEEPAEGAELSRAQKSVWRARRDGIELGRFTQHAALVHQVLEALPRDQA